MANITRYNPYGELVTLRDAMGRLFEDGVLTLTIPKAEEVKPRQVKVRPAIKP
jgi:HSP20 family molecular chaperone IbpA